MKAVVAAFNQEKALVGAFSVITNLWMQLFEALQPGAVVGEAAAVAHPAAGLRGEVTSEVAGGAAQVSRNISKYDGLWKM